MGQIHLWGSRRRSRSQGKDHTQSKKKGRWRKDRLLTVPGSSCNLFRRAFQLGHGRVEMGDMREPILYKGEDGEYFWDTEAILTGIAKGFPIPPLVGLLLLGC